MEPGRPRPVHGRMRTLVLNVDSTALHILDAGDALIHVLMGKAESVLDTDRIAHSQYLAVPFPSIIRLNEYVHAPRSGRSIPITRRTVVARDRGRCGYCSGPADSIDHIQPKDAGGPHKWENVIAACTPCNSRKRNRTPEQARMPLLFQPTRPRGAHARLLLGMSDPAWEPYLLKDAS